MRWTSLLFCFLLCQSEAVFVRAAESSPPSVRSVQKGRRARIAQAIDRAEAYLRRQAMPSGRFRYMRHAALADLPDRQYNTLRHAGSLYALSQAYARRSRAATGEAMVRGAVYLVSSFIRPLPDQPSLFALWVPREERPPQSEHLPPQAKLGGAGLALVALIHVEGHFSGTTSREILQGLGRFILFMQREDGSFHSLFIAGQGFCPRTQSLYFPGEAMLGLALLYRLDGDERWLEAAFRGLAYLSKKRRGAARVPADHWALLATQELLPLHAVLKNPPVSREEILHHSRQICREILRNQKPYRDSELLDGAVDSAGRICPVATRVEGLLAALPWLKGDDETLGVAVREGIDRGINYLLRSQLQSPRVEGAFSRGFFDQERMRPAPGMDHRALEVRIDYTQHALSALVGAEALLSPVVGKKTAP